MLDLLWLIPAVPYAGFVLLAFFGRRLGRAAGLVGAGTVGLSFLLTLAVGAGFFGLPAEGRAFTQVLWTWMNVDGFAPRVALYLDALSLLMTAVITFVGFLIHVYALEYMDGDKNFPRFFAFLNLFVGAMLTLVLADNLPLLYLGWEGVGLCSYLLIGFWFEDPENGRSARKAFIVTRVGDVALGLGLFLLFAQLGTLDIQPMLRQAATEWPAGSTVAVVAAVLILIGAIGKSAQAPLHVWLPDAMAGPTPVSALLHSATMVTAGVYLIARTHGLFLLAPQAMGMVAAVGAVTLLLAGVSALAQNDIKRALAYSTVSQIGYMFLALGVGAWVPAMFHFFTHAFFKALLFMGAGAVLHATGQGDMTKLGGLKEKMPAVFWTFLAGASALAALPLVTAGFYSKDWILARVYASGGMGLWAMGVAGAFLTSLYTFRIVFLTFFGAAKSEMHHRPGPRLLVPMMILAGLALVAGFLQTPPTLGHVTAFSGFMGAVFPPVAVESHGLLKEALFQIFVTAVSLLGVGAAYFLFVLRPDVSAKFAASARGLRGFFAAGWGFDALYDRLFVRPLFWIASRNRNDAFEAVNTGMAAVNQLFHYMAASAQTGRLRWYAMALGAGAAVLLSVVLL